METLGPYRIVRELSRKPYGIIYSARKEGDPEEYLIKVFNPQASTEEELSSDPLILSFLESAVLQMKITQAKAKFWAPIVDMGICPEGGFYVSRFYSSSAKRLVDGHVHLPSETLKALSMGIVGGLREVQAIDKRAHGGLYLTSILIDRNRITDPRATVLAEPAPADVAAQHGIPGDLANLGKILYQLITHKPYSETSTLWPVHLTEDWKHLGSAANAWLGLVNWLMDPQASEQTHTLDELERRLLHIRKKKSKKPLILLGAAAMVLIAGGGGFGAWYFSMRSQWRQFTELSRDPSLAQTIHFYANYAANDELKAGLGRPQLANHPQILAIRSALDELTSRGVVFDFKAMGTDPRITESSAPLDVLMSKRWKSAGADIARLKQAIDGWKVPQELLEQAARLGEWPELREQVELAAKKAGIKKDHPDIEAMIEAVDWKNAMGDFNWLDAMQGVRSGKQSLTNFEDPLLKQFPQIADSFKSAGGKVKTPADMRIFRDRLEKSAALAKALEEAVKTDGIRKRLSSGILSGSEFYQGAEANIRASSDRVVPLMEALALWPDRVMAIPLPGGPDVSPLKERLNLARMDAKLLGDYVDKSDVDSVLDRIKGAEDSIGAIDAPDIGVEQRNTLTRQAEGRLDAIEAQIKDFKATGEAKRAMLLAAGGEFSKAALSVETQIARVREFNPGKAKGVADKLEELKKQQEAFQEEYRGKRESEITTRSDELRSLLKDLLTTASGIQPPEPMVDIVRYAATPTLAAPLKDALSKAWDEWEISVVGEKQDQVPKSVNQKLEPLITEFDKLDAEAKKIVFPQLSAQGEVALKAGEKLGALAMENAAGLIAKSVKPTGAGDPIDPTMMGSLVATQTKWNENAGKWLKAWDEIESALQAGKSSAEKHLTDTPANLRKAADAIAQASGFPNEPIKPLSDRMDQLIEIESLPATAESATPVFDAIATGKPELAMAGSKLLAMMPLSGDSLEKIGATREIGAKLPENLRDAVFKRLDEAAAASLKTVLSSGSDFDSISTAKAIRDLKKKAGLTTSTTADDLASMRKELEAVGLWDLPSLRANLAIKQARTIDLSGNDPALRAIKEMFDILPQDYRASIDDPGFQELMKKLLEQKDILDKFNAPAVAEGGPEKSGLFKPAESGDADVLLFTATFENKPRQLAFRRLRGAEGKPVFVSVTETPLWVMAMLAKNKSIAMNDLGAAEETSETARAWYDNGGTVTIRPGWLPDYDDNGKAFSPYPQSLMAAGKPNLLNEAQAPGANPSMDQPAHFISPAGAIKAAKALNCRLPKAGEWTLAAAKQEEAPNLRDKSWEDFTKHLRDAGMTKIGVSPGIPTPEEFGAPRQPTPEKANEGAPWSKTQLTGAIPKAGLAGTPAFVEKVAEGTISDGYVFLRPAIAKEKYPFADLIGNVWEMTSEGGESAQALKLVGGSALSPVGAGVGEMNPWSWSNAGLGAAEGFADVGFRLVFEGKEEQPKPEIAPAVKKLLSDAKYVGK